MRVTEKFHLLSSRVLDDIDTNVSASADSASGPVVTLRFRETKPGEKDGKTRQTAATMSPAEARDLAKCLADFANRSEKLPRCAVDG